MSDQKDPHQAESCNGGAGSDHIPALPTGGEDSYRRIFDLANDAIFIHDVETNEILDVNVKMCDLFGYSLEEARRLSLEDLFSGKPPYTLENALTLVEKVRAGEPQLVEWHVKKCDGTVFWVEISIKRVVLAGKDRILAVVRDISDRKEVERKLVEARDRAQNYLDIVGAMMVVIHADQSVILINKKGCEVLGYPEDEIVGKNWFDNFLPAHNQDPVRVVFNELIRGEIDPVEYFENPVLTKGGEERIIRWHNTIIRDDDGTISGTLSSGEDITELQRGLEALQESEERFRAAFEQSLNSLVLIDPGTGDIVKCNRKAYETLGYTFEEFQTLNLSDIDAVETPADVLAHMDKINREGSDEFETKHRTKTDEILDVIVYSTVIRYHNKTLLLSNWYNITERKRTERELQKSREQLRELAAHLQSVREDERTSIAREIHDELGQVLTALKMDLSWLEGKLSTEQDSLADKVRSMKDLTDTTIQTIKRISTELRPGILDDLGLFAAVEWQTEEFQNRTGITCNVTLEPDEFNLDEKLSTAIFRIFQEALTNVARHSHATMVDIFMHQQAEKLVFMIKDDGTGIRDGEISSPRSFGLISMRERCISLGGDIHISGRNGRGTTVAVSIPLPEE